MKAISKKTNPSSGLLNNEQAACYLGISPNTLNGWRSQRFQEISYIKVGHRVYYKKEALDQYLEANTVEIAATG